MKTGDLVRIQDCHEYVAFYATDPPEECDCFWCAGNSNRIGCVIGPAASRPSQQGVGGNAWYASFDCGEMIIWDGDAFVEVISPHGH